MNINANLNTGMISQTIDLKNDTKDEQINKNICAGFGEIHYYNDE